ncbi:flagellin [Candidatus Allofournierella merdavium]|uniref:flagellin N-terminal helical domain-containing protein n=1 Tax=Candidatus Allofournierella merdavium TaxID=2838593 RepID=UPI00374EE28F
MRIQNNIMAMNAYRNYTNNTSALSKNLEKLSSGYKINRAGDDAAGLAISEKMRAQITGLEGAQKNAKDGISLVQTAEGALTEVHDMLNRMYSLAEQSANGTYENETDRAQLQKEVSNLKDEIDRIAKSSNFNGIKLLDGSLAETKVDITTASLNGSNTINTVNASKTTSTVTIGAGNDGTEQELTVEYTDANGKLQTTTVTYTASTTAADNAAAMKDALLKDSALSGLFNITTNGTTLQFEAKEAGDSGIKITGITADDAATAITAGSLAVNDGASAYQSVAAGIATGGTNQDLEAGDYITINGTTYEFVAKADDETTNKNAVKVVLGSTDSNTVANLNKLLKEEGIEATINGTAIDFKSIQDGAGLSLQIGDTGEDFNQLTVSIKDCHTAAMGIADLDIGTQAGAKAALATIENAINYISDVRGGLGATQNRLDHTINNLSVMQENIQDAESSIRDTDIAEEMMSYTKNNILIQSAQAMLAQANQVPQGVLQLMQ